jgi:hypothetical protein
MSGGISNPDELLFFGNRNHWHQVTPVKKNKKQKRHMFVYVHA